MSDEARERLLGVVALFGWAAIMGACAAFAVWSVTI